MTDGAFWVFGYGSLMWNPGFDFQVSEVATLTGFHRSFCMRSIHHRGTSENPGLVLALDRSTDALCDGLAFRIGAEHASHTLTTLRERELISSAYLEAELEITLKGGKSVTAVTYIIDPDHVQYCGDLPLEEQAQIIAIAVGGRGPNTEYLYNTADHLEKLGLQDSDLNWLVNRTRSLAA